MKRIACAAIVALGVVTTVSADPLDVRRVSREAKWMVHVDFTAVKETELARYVAERWLVLPAAQKSLREAREHIGIDPIEDLVGVTFYGRSYRPEDGVVLIEAGGKRDLLAKFLRQQSGYETVAYRTHTIHRWKEVKEDSGEQTVMGAMYGDRLLVVGKNEALLKEAIDVLDGVAPSMADAESALAVQPPAGASVTVVATGFEETDAPFKSPVLRQSRRIALAMGETDGITFLWGELLARSEESAEQIGAVVDGMFALVRMQFVDDAEILAALRPLAVSVSQSCVTARWQGRAAEAIPQFERAVKKLQEEGKEGLQPRQ